MTKTLSKMIEELSQLKHRRTIYEQLVGFLSQYVPDELSVDADPAELETAGVGSVPVELLQDTIDDLEENGIAYLEKQIKKLERLEIPVDEEESEESPGKESPRTASRKGRKTVGKTDSGEGDSNPAPRVQLRRKRKAKAVGPGAG